MKALFYPDKPIRLPGHTLSKTIIYCERLGWDVTNDPDDNWDFGVLWDAQDIVSVPDIFASTEKLVVNIGCVDVTKWNVDRIHNDVFGYSILVPAGQKGYCVRKHPGQSAKNSKIVECPDGYCNDGYLYQRLIDSRISHNFVRDYRVPIFWGNIPLVFLKDRPVEQAFKIDDRTLKVSVAETKDVFSNEELLKICDFASEIGLDVGEMDIVRSNYDGLIYILDVNNIPGSRVFGHVDISIVDKLTNVFRKELLKNIQNQKS